tara:strand:- start:297 stop:941 length:645 start_codon:yes stop_codon:yes gene_type:complete
MKVISLNAGQARTVNYKGKNLVTGIFKSPVSSPIYLGETDVKNDNVVDRKFHGGIDKAVYAYSVEHYPFWKKIYPNLEWNYGMFGENLTIQGLSESLVHIGNKYKIGQAVIEVCQPRQPCFKLGLRFETQNVLKQFVNSPYSGVYFRVSTPGLVHKEDQLKLMHSEPDTPTIAEVYLLMYKKQSGADALIEKTINCTFLPMDIRETIRERQARL